MTKKKIVTMYQLENNLPDSLNTGLTTRFQYHVRKTRHDTRITMKRKS